MPRQEDRDYVPPYVSYSTWRRLMEAFKTYLPDDVGASFYRNAKFSTSSTKMLRPSLRYLGLVDAKDVPTETLTKLVSVLRAGDDVEKEVILREIVRKSYPTLFTDDFDLGRASPERLSERFDALGVAGATQQKCITFFKHIASEAGIELSRLLAGRSRLLGIGRKSIVQKAREARGQAKKQLIKESIPEHELAVTSQRIHPAIAALLGELPPLGSSWDMEDYETFYESFTEALDATLRYIYRIRKKESYN